ncbi:MAG: caspase family protein [Nitrospira sp.]|nr:MAG: caspase family protein [Nitrospira sp.]
MGPRGRIQWVAHCEGSGQEGKTQPGLSFDSWGVVADDDGSRCHARHVTESHPGCLRQSCQLRPVPHQLPIRIEAWEHALTERHSGPCLWTVVMAALLVTMIAWPTAAAEGKRVAFVVGIGTYDNLSADKQLRNAVNDAEGVSAKLTEIGFQVTKASNLTRSAFNAKWQDVLNSLTKEDTFVLFFSGHGIQLDDGGNYLLPRDVPYIEYGRNEQLKRESISLNELLADLAKGDRPHPKSSVVILDACRDNPLIPPGHSKSVSAPKGLARVPESDGIFVMYAAASNRTALDRLSTNDPVEYSVFTRVLLSLLGRSDLTIQELTIKVRDEVVQLT